MASLPPSAFLVPPLHFSRTSHRRSVPIRRHLPHIEPSALTRSSPLDIDLPLEAPLVVFVAVVLAFSAQSWINSLLGGDQGLGAFLSDGTGFKKSGFKPRRPITDERAFAGDPTKPLGGPDPLPWLKLPQLDYVDVAGQPKGRDQTEVVAKMEDLREQMQIEIEQGNFQDAKLVEEELERLMKEEGYDFSS